MNNLYEHIMTAKQYINNQSSAFQAKFGIILGTGLGQLVDDITTLIEIPYSDIPNFPISTVQGHAGKLILGHLEDIPIIAMAGRFHYYEGYSAKEITFPIRVLKALGIESLFISSAVGSVNAQMEAGDIVLVKDHINLLPDNPLRGPNHEKLGLRFPDMKTAYSPELLSKALEKANALDIPVHTGVYLALQGPNLETPAEYRFANIIGADLIGMSTVPEVLVAKHAELPVLVSTVVSNKCFPIEEIQETTVEDVLAVVAKATPKVTQLIKAMIKELV